MLASDVPHDKCPTQPQRTMLKPAAFEIVIEFLMDVTRQYSAYQKLDKVDKEVVALGNVISSQQHLGWFPC